jgi:TRAP-type C4-dicarboxylate transport system substrate-binding protein
VMNPLSYAALPRDLQRLIDETTGTHTALEVAARWEAMDLRGKQYVKDSGIEIIEPDAAARAEFAAAGETVIERRLASTEAQGLPARAFFARVKRLAADYRPA